jgi:hypothetical protein
MKNNRKRKETAYSSVKRFSIRRIRNKTFPFEIPEKEAKNKQNNNYQKIKIIFDP